ncbi:MAG: aminomethyl transferase family protein [Alphaproteobacteria bacterium]|nr:MAG: aminomethyl transferase family protein [Alphaproteobacteria bacterium]
MSSRSLEDKIKEVGNPVDMLRNAQIGPYEFPIKSEFSNWRDEQEAWNKTAVLFDQSYHMTDHYIEGPDVKRLLKDLGINSFETFGRNKAKQLVVCNYDGYVIGDAILFGLEEDKVNIVNRPVAGNWVQFHAETGGYDVKVDKDDRALDNTGVRKGYRFEVQGPNAWEILEKVNGGPIEGFKFFGMGEITIAGRKVRALRHGMAGAAGLELFGPYEEREDIRGAILEAGRDLGLLEAGSKTYSTVAHESGWIPSPLPAIFTGDKMKAFREWLPADGFEANGSLGGSMVSDNVEDYYLTPWDLGYGHILKFDHDFIGREALEKMKDQPHRKKMTLVWEPEDVIRIFASLFNDGDRFKFMDMPASHYATYPYDMVVKGDRQVGISCYPVYTSNYRRWISLCMLDESVANVGDELEIVWGEPGGGSDKPVVERHIQTRVRAKVTDCPISKTAREVYRKNP